MRVVRIVIGTVITAIIALVVGFVPIVAEGTELRPFKIVTSSSGSFV